MTTLQPPSIAEWKWSGDEKGAEDKFCINLSSRLKDSIDSICTSIVNSNMHNSNMHN